MINDAVKNSLLNVEKLERLKCQSLIFFNGLIFFPLGARRGNSYVKFNKKILKDLIIFAPCFWLID